MLRLLYYHRSPPSIRLATIIQCRTLSDAAQSSSSSSRIISRRAWQEYVRKHPPRNTQKAAPKKQAEKPWPKSLQMAGYTMAAIFIPYSIAWFLASNGSARALVVHSSQIMDDLLRHHFGEQEQDVNYYQTMHEGLEPHYQLDGEASYKERCQEEEIQALNSTDVKVRVRINGGDDFVDTVVSGTTPARVQDILSAIGKESLQTSNDTVVAIDFGRVVGDANETQDGQLTSEDTIVVSLEADTLITRETNIYSLWQYITSTKQQEEKPRFSSSDTEIARLEHEISQLQSDLRNVHCTRDRDDMERELRQCKSALRNLKWKRRFGF